MKVFIQATFIMFYVLTILFGCATFENAIRADQHVFYNEGIALVKAGEYDRAIA